MLLSLVLAAPAWAGSPQVDRVAPRGAQLGTELVLTFHGKRLAGAQDVLFYGEGLSASGLKAHKKGKQVSVQLTVAPDCPLGEHALRLRCSDGLSELRTFWVGALPEVAEREPNGEFGEPQQVPLERTITGRIDKEDVEYFAFQASKGQRITAEVEGMRLGGAAFDPTLVVLDAQRFQLAANDDAPLLGQDPLLSFVAPADGTYVLELRDAAYRGGGNYDYRLHLGTFPRPRAVVPAGGQPGQTVHVDFYGDVAGVDSADWVVPPGPVGTVELWPRRGGVVAPSPLRIRRGPWPGVLEVEPNGRKRATVAPAPPFALHGRIERPGDQDWFRFPAQKNQRLRIRAWARDLGSPLDPVLNVFVVGGKHLKGNDDVKGRPDSELTWKAPKDGDYELRVRDFLERGSETHSYRIEVTPVVPALSLALKTYGRNSQDRNAVVVPRGNRHAVLVQVKRQDMQGPVALSFGDLPAGIAAVHTAVCAKRVSFVPVVFEAGTSASLGAGLVSLRGRHAEQPEIGGGFRQGIPISFGPPNNAVYWTHTQDRLAVAVTEAVPFRIRLVPPPAPLVRRGSAQLTVVVERDAGFENQVELWLIMDPPGVGSAKRVKVPKGKTRATISLNANGKAALGRWPLVVIAKAGHRGGPVWISSELRWLEVADSLLSLQLERAAGEQGGHTELVAAITVPQPFEGEATARLVRLPQHCTAPTLTLTADTTELRFPVTVGVKAKPGRHRHVFCQVVVQRDGHPVVHNLGDAELRVDKPRPRAAAQPAAPAQPEAPKPPTRLEQLRAEHAASKQEGGQ